MLRITVVESPSERRWVLQGRLIGPWAAELKTSWKKTHADAKGRVNVVDLREVTFIDAAGEKVLSRMMQEDAQFVVCGVYATHVIDNLWARCKSRSRVSDVR